MSVHVADVVPVEVVGVRVEGQLGQAVPTVARVLGEKPPVALRGEELLVGADVAAGEAARLDGKVLQLTPRAWRSSPQRLTKTNVVSPSLSARQG